MRKPRGFDSRLAIGVLAAIALIGVTTSQGAATNLPQPAPETGYPGELINRPVCWTHPGANSENPRCGTGSTQHRGVRSPF